MPAQLVAYSGFSATNYVQEAYSADLDYGTGEWSMGAWVSAPAVLPLAGYPVIAAEKTPNFGWSGGYYTNGAKQIPTSWEEYNATNVSASSVLANSYTFTATSHLAGISVPTFYYNPAGKGIEYRIKARKTASSSGSPTLMIYSGAWHEVIPYTAAIGDWYTFTVRAVAMGNTIISSFNGAASWEVEYISVRELGLATLVERSAATGPSIKLGMSAAGQLVATAYDGTTTRTVTTTAAYNTGTFTKVRATYTAAGKLGITVNGVEVASTTGTPLLTLNTGAPLHNLLTKTELFSDASWTKQAGMVLTQISGAEWELDLTGSANATGMYGFSSLIPALAAYTVSLELRYVTAGGNNTVFIGEPTGASGTISSGTKVLTSEWVKHTLAGSNTVAANRGIWIQKASGGVSVIRIRFPQVELGTVANAYQRVGTTTADYDTAAAIKASLTIGNSRALDAPFPGSITMFKTGATVPTTEQSLWMYEQEKQMFRADAQITLPASTAVNDLAYDESQDKWTAVQAGYESTFTGLIRTSANVPSAGSFAKVDTKSGVEIMSRTGTNPGVDVTVPAMNLKEELVRRAEAAAKSNKPLVPIPFDAIAAQTDFVLPVGYVTASVMLAGVRKREGATKDYVLLYDGFRETVRFAVAPGAAAWVEVSARKE